MIPRAKFLPPAVEGHIEALYDRLGPWLVGVDFSQPVELTHPQALFDGRNVEILRDGSVQPRAGCSKYIASAYSGTPGGLSIGKHKFSAASSAVFYITSSGLFLENVSGTWTDRTNGVTISTDVDDFITYADAFGTAYFAGVNSDPIKWAASGNIAVAGVSSRFTHAAKVLFWDDRLWYFKTNNSAGELWWSTQADLEVINANSFYELNETITGAIVHKNRLYVHTDNSIFAISPTGNTTAPYTKDRVADFGTGAIRGLVKLPTGYQMYIREDGFYMWDGGSAEKKINTRLDGDRFWNLVNTDALYLAHSVVDTTEGRVFFWLPANATDTTCTTVMVYNYLYDFWSPPWTGIARSASAIVDKKIYSAGYSDGLVYSHSEGDLDDNGTTFDPWFETSGKAPEGEQLQIQWLFFRLYFTAQLVDFSAFVSQQSPDGEGESALMEIESEGDAIEDEFTIGESGISGIGSLVRKEMRGANFTPYTQLRVQGAETAEVFNLRFLDRFYQPHGIVREDNN